MESAPLQGIPSAEAEVNSAIEKLHGNSVQVQGDHIVVAVNACILSEEDKRDFIRSRREQRARSRARISALLQSTTFPVTRPDQFYDED